MGKGNILVPLDRVEELENRIQDIPLVLLNGSWVREEDENGNLLYYRQDVEVKGLSADSTPMIFPKWAGEEPVEEELNAYDCLIGEPIITEGNIRFMANPMPQWSFTMVAKGAMASEGQDIDAVAGLVAKINELETEVDGLNRNKVDTTDSRLSDARTPLAHTHDDRYYTESEVNALLNNNKVKYATKKFTQSSSFVYELKISGLLLSASIIRGSSTGSSYAFVNGIEYWSSNQLLLHFNEPVTGGTICYFYV